MLIYNSQDFYVDGGDGRQSDSSRNCLRIFNVSFFQDGDVGVGNLGGGSVTLVKLNYQL